MTSVPCSEKPCASCGYAVAPGNDCEECAGRILNEKLDRLLDGCISALGDFSTEDLRAMASARDQINPDGWMQRMILEYIDVWR